MYITQRYTPDIYDVLSWDDLKVGDVYYHIFAKTVNMKTSKNSYISFSDHKYHTRSKLLQGSKSKTYVQIYAKFDFAVYVSNSSGCEDK